jgi:hypothetical protein
MNQVERALREIVAVLETLGHPYALVGGLAVSARAEPRTTRDVDVAIGVADDRAAEEVVHAFVERGYGVAATVEHKSKKRLATVRLRRPSEASGVLVDLLFSSSGIEAEIVAGGSALEVVPGLRVPVASIGHLIATKVLARDDRERPQDWDDLRALIHEARGADLADARQALASIEERGFHRGRDLRELLEQAIAEHRIGPRGG